MKKLFRKVLDINWTIAIVPIILGIFGVLVVLSASAILTIKYGTSEISYALKQATFVVAGIFAMFIVSVIDFDIYQKYSKYIWALSIIFILLGLFTPLTIVYNGYAKRGLNLGIIKFMPSDIYKIASILFLANFLVWNKKNEKEYLSGFIFTSAIIGIPTMLIVLQPDLSTSISILATLFTMYMIGGYQKKFLIPSIIIVALALLAFFLAGMGYQMDRIRGWLDPEKYAYSSRGFSWQILNSLFAVSRGGFFGVGYGKSVLKFGYLSNEATNDMIFAVIAEEFGFFGSVILICVIFFLFILMIKEALECKNLYGKYVVFGIASLYIYQSLINIGVSTNLIPNTGITLPFISYGGTSIIMYFVMMGIVLSVSRYNKSQRFNEKMPSKQE